MPSMTLMMSTIFFDESLIEAMVSTTCATTCPPLLATPDADCAIWLAWRALSAFCLTVLVSSSIEAAVSSSELACCSVRDDRSWLPAAISDDDTFTDSLAVRIFTSTAAILSMKRLKAPAICASSSTPEASRRRVRSPSPEAMSSSASRTSSRRLSILNTSSDSSSAASPVSSAAVTVAVVSIVCKACMASC
ncbi:hypothetical protein D3C87_712830 [compost metagenome]